MTEIDINQPIPDVMAQIVAIAETTANTHTPQEALSQERRAQLIADLLKAERAANDLRVAATRLQMVAMRQVALLGAASSLPKHKAEAAAAFAALNEVEFRQLIDGVVTVTEPSAVYRLLKHRLIAEEAERIAGVKFSDLIECRTGFEPPEEDGRMAEYEAEDLRDTFQALLSGPPYADEPFTIAEIAAAAARKLEASTGSSVWQNGAVQQLLNEAARRNVMVGPADEFGVPEFLTVHDPELGWVRIPAQIALLAHLKAHALIREQQMRQLENRVKELNKTVRRFEELLDEDEDDHVSINELIGRAIDQHRPQRARRAA